MASRRNGINDVKLRICQECGAKCCYASPLLTLHDVSRLSGYLGIPTEEFVKRYCTVSEERGYAFMRLKKVQGRCVFLSGALCQVNPVKPIFCRVFPVNYMFSGLGGFYCPLAERAELLEEELSLYPQYVNELEALFGVVARCKLDVRCVLSALSK